MVDPDIKVHMLGTYVSLRRLMALVTALFLVVLLWYRVGGAEPGRDSISAYYYHDKVDFPMRDVFVATLFAVGLLLIAYQGYTDGENRLLNVGGFALLCVVFFPMDQPGSTAPRSLRATVHYASALVFFACIAAVSVFYARNTLDLVSTQKRKKWYLRAYWITGWLMAVLPLTAIVLHFAAGLGSEVFWVEFAGAVAFLAYWTVKSLELESTKAEKENKVSRLPAYSSAGKTTRQED